VIALAAPVFGFALSAGAVAANVVPNAGFEQGGCGSTAVICGWNGHPVMSQDTTYAHSGSASMYLRCGVLECYTGGWTAVFASTDPSFCAAIGPGTHPASFWALSGASRLALDATFYQGTDCTGPVGSDSFGGWVSDPGWDQFTGDLVAPAGTRSASFDLSAGLECDDFCGPWAYFDDVDVEDSVAPDTTPPQTTITSDAPDPASTSATFTFTASEQSTFECSLDDAAFASCTSPATYSALADGPHTFRVRAVDRAGNTDPTPAEQDWTVDTFFGSSTF
jgi:hypothetical protein